MMTPNTSLNLNNKTSIYWIQQHTCRIHNQPASIKGLSSLPFTTYAESQKSQITTVCLRSVGNLNTIWKLYQGLSNEFKIGGVWSPEVFGMKNDGQNITQQLSISISIPAKSALKGQCFMSACTGESWNLRPINLEPKVTVATHRSRSCNDKDSCFGI